MRRDAVRQLRTVAGRQAAATAQEEAAGISGGQEAKARHSAYAPREGVVLLDYVVGHAHRRIRFGSVVHDAAVRRPGRVHVAGRLRAGTGAVHYDASRTPDGPVQLHVELLPGGMHQRRVQLQSHFRDVQDGRWRRRRRRRCGRVGCRAAGQHQGLRVSPGRDLFELHQIVRQRRLHVPLPLFPAEPHAGRGRLRQAAAVRRHRALLRRAVLRVRLHVRRAVRHALRLSERGKGDRTSGTVQESRRTFERRRIQRSFDKHSRGTIGRRNNESFQNAGRAERIMTILGDAMLSA